MRDFLPVAMRDITKSAADDGRSGWDDVGGLIDIRNSIKEVWLHEILECCCSLTLFLGSVLFFQVLRNIIICKNQLLQMLKPGGGPRMVLYLITNKALPDLYNMYDAHFL